MWYITFYNYLKENIGFPFDVYLETIRDFKKVLTEIQRFTFEVHIDLCLFGICISNGSSSNIFSKGSFYFIRRVKNNAHLNELLLNFTDAERVINLSLI